MAVDVFETKYSHTKEDGTKENIAEVFSRVSKTLAKNEKDPAFWETSWETDMMEGWYRPGGSILSGVNSQEMISLANCTTIPMLGDSITDIMKCMADAMHCAARRQGLGVDVTPLRPAKAKVNNSALESTGAIPWMDFIQSMGKYVGQNSRIPAILLSLNISHPDIYAFCTSKTDLGVIENANISVQITDDFMEAVKNDNPWELYFKTHHETITKTVQARDLFRLISKQARDSAEPGVQFIDDMRRGSMIHQIYLATQDGRFEIISTNACCFVEETPVLTDKGKITIADIRDGMEEGQRFLALSYNLEKHTQEWKPIIDCFPRDEGIPQQTVTITLGNKEKIECTPDHSFMTTRGWVQARCLTSYDKLMPDLLDNHLIKIKSLKYNEKKRTTWNITVEDNHNYYANGVLVKNSEKPLPPYGSCMLGSINMDMFSTDKETYKDQLKRVIPNLVRLIDCAISYEIEEKRYGVPEQKIIMELTREIGIGFTNLHQWFINAGIQYDSDKAVEMIDDFMSWYAFYAFEASQDIAEEKGPAGVYNESIAPCMEVPRSVPTFSNKDLMGSTFFKNIVNKFYDGDYSKVRPLRNLALISIAPTGSISLVFPRTCISSGAEPAMPAHWRKTRAISKGEYEYYFIFPSFIKDELKAKIAEETSDERFDDHRFINKVGEATPDNGGELGTEVMFLIDKYIGKGTFKPAHEIDPMQKVKMMSRLYKWVDAAVSITYNVPGDTTTENIEEIYMAAWEQGVRAVSVYREGSREGILVFEPPENDQKKKTIYCEERPENITFTCAPKRNNEMKCEIHHCRIQGKSWLVLVGIHNDYPYEIFAGEYCDEMPVPQTVKEGILKKVGTKYSLIVPIRKSEVEYKDIAATFLQEKHRSLTRMISLSLRHGTRPAFISDQLKKADEGITEFSSVVSRVLSKYMKTRDYEYLTKKNKEGDTCQFCDGTDWHFEGGCAVCANCGKGSRCD